MSRVSPDKMSSAEVLAQLKDQYASRERDSEVRHREEVGEIRESHRSEIDKVKTDAQKRIQDMQEEVNVKLTQKDLQNQKEIEAMRAIYAKRAADGRKPPDDSG